MIPTSLTAFVDYEAELGVVIGRAARRVSVDDALDFVLGYTCANDVSARDQQFADGQWVRARASTRSARSAPDRDGRRDPGSAVRSRIHCAVNGEALQQSSTAELIFGVAEIISYLSQTATLLPGDLILTGTPAGVGHARNPQVRLRDGDVVTVTIESIGTLTNPVGSVTVSALTTTTSGAHRSRGAHHRCRAGIGLESARLLARRGAKVVLFDRTADELEAATAARSRARRSRSPEM